MRKNKSAPLIQRVFIRNIMYNTWRAAVEADRKEEKRMARLEKKRSRGQPKRKREEDDIAEERLHKRQRV
ncbi:hypothetical protein BY458DRAFT_559217 [Sporodiniella umbellata]|nr:hypothetical protein BY458DRAFT_559211 [Sporodiniella umbellata]KAI9252617.1 hypothetical protein BY458DRAFT_559217 [Sporodiniella umbellata]